MSNKLGKMSCRFKSSLGQHEVYLPLNRIAVEWNPNKSKELRADMFFALNWQITAVVKYLRKVL